MKKVLFLFFVLPFIIGATYYFDATNGLDTNNGTTTESAWQTYSVTVL
jgi:hypothetical protein